MNYKGTFPHTYEKEEAQNYVTLAAAWTSEACRTLTDEAALVGVLAGPSVATGVSQAFVHIWRQQSSVLAHTPSCLASKASDIRRMESGILIASVKKISHSVRKPFCFYD